MDVLQDDSQFVHIKGEEERVLIDCSLCETYGESESLTLEASSSDMGSLKIESKIIDLGYLGSQFTWRGQKSPRFSRVY